MCKALQLSANLKTTLQSIRATAEELNKQLSNADLFITDIQHKIEFGKFNVVDGYKTAKQLQGALKDRRKIKDEWELIQPLITYTGNIEKNVEKIHNNINEREIKMESRTYRPRILEKIN